MLETFLLILTFLSSEPTKYQYLPIPTKEDEKCLALNIYHEARNQKFYGKLGVVLVTFNRVLYNKYPNTICSVITQAKKNNGKVLKYKCAFSWYCDGKSDIPYNKEEWRKAKNLAKITLKNAKFMKDITIGATMYHADYVKPRWNFNKLIRTVKLHKHIFYWEYTWKK